VLFILCGAFVGIEKLIQRRRSPGSIGFGSERSRQVNPDDADYNALIKEVTPEDFIKYGLIPEFMGRLPVVVPFERSTKRRSTRSSGSRELADQAVQEAVRAREGEPPFTPEAMRAIVREAVVRKSGARGLRAIIEEIMLDIMYELPDMTDVSGVRDHRRGGQPGRAPELVLAKKSA
jgi:ATP-dependent Clp protease ATP-binding subunit ClpX